MSKDLKLIAIGYPDKRVEDDLQPMLHTFTETLKLSKETTPILPPGVPDVSVSVRSRFIDADFDYHSCSALEN